MLKREEENAALRSHSLVDFPVSSLFSVFFFFFFVFLPFVGLLPAAYEGSQARGLIGAPATSLCWSHSNAGSEPRLQPTPQLMAMPDP